MGDISLVSYTAADTLPIKMLIHPDTKTGMDEGVLIPTHIQLALTNKCNLLCPFCSYGKVDRGFKLGKKRIRDLLVTFSDLGTRAVTVTGGGEPTLHPHFNYTLDLANWLAMETGLITNGTLLDRVDPKPLNMLRWCRVSCSDYWDYDKYANIVKKVRDKAYDPDWGMSYVVLAGEKHRPYNFMKCIQLANTLGFKYVRVVADLTCPEQTPQMEELQAFLKIHDVDVSRVIYQGRKNTTKGFRQCWISLIKPYIGADGGVYPCCAVQYAKDPVSFDTPVDMRMGTLGDVSAIWEKQEPFDGSVCVRCHYHQYNTVWGVLKQGVDHAEFI